MSTHKGELYLKLEKRSVSQSAQGVGHRGSVPKSFYSCSCEIKIKSLISIVTLLTVRLVQRCEHISPEGLVVVAAVMVLLFLPAGLTLCH